MQLNWETEGSGEMLFFRLEIFLFVETYVDRRVGISREITWDKSSAHVFIRCYALDSNPTWTKPSSGTKNFCVQHCLGRAAPGQFMGVEEGRGGEGLGPVLSLMGCLSLGLKRFFPAASAPFPASPSSIPACSSCIWPWFSAEASPVPFVCCCLGSVWSWKPGIQVLVVSFILPCCAMTFWGIEFSLCGGCCSSRDCCIWISRNVNF